MAIKRRVFTESPTSGEPFTEFYLNEGGTLTPYIFNGAGEPQEVSPDKGFLEYRAVVSQDLTANPTAVVRKNELGVEITFTRLDTGVYQIGGVPSNSDVTISKNTISSQIGINITIGYVSSENIFYSNVGGSLSDSVINQSTLTIRKYPD